MPPRFSIIVPSYNRSRELEKCLASLMVCHRPNAEIIVVDDCSTDDVTGIAQGFGAAHFSCVQRGGPAAARNLGAKHAKGEIFVFVDADVVVRPDLLRIVDAEFEAEPNLAALFGSYDDAPAEPDFYSSFKNLLHHHVHQTSSVHASTFWTGCGAMRREVFESVGGFNTSLYSRASIEDIEFGSRLRREGHKIRLVKSLQVKHLKRWTAKSIVTTDVFRRAMPWTRLIVKTKSMPEDLNLSWPSRMSAVLAGCWFALILILVVRGMGWSRIPLQRVFAEMGVVAAGLLALNSGLYGFFWRKRGSNFALRAILAHWLYLSYSGTVFAGCFAHEVGRSAFRSFVRSSALAVFRRNSS
jgi:glycosyltransferase involved in cell wall biosynthesis